MKRFSRTFISFVVLAIIYISVSLIAAPPRTVMDQYHVSSSTLRIINAAVVLPVVAIWFLGLYGYEKLRVYAGHIKDNDEGRYVYRLSQGVMLITLTLPITSTSSAVFNALAVKHPGWKPATTIVVNYLSLLLSLLAFWYISRGARRLSELAKRRPSQNMTHIIALLLIAAGVTYAYLIANAHHDIYTIFHMPVPLVMLTLVVPYIFTWYLGVLAAYEIHLYTARVRGALYRTAWNNLAYGVIWLLLFSIVLQYLTSVSARLGNLPIGVLLVLIYFILAIRVIGYIFIARGSKKLTQIEEA